MFTEVDRFETLSDSGQRYTVVKLQHWTMHRTSTGEVEQRPGRVEWKTACGLELSDNDDGTFEMIDRDEILRRV